MEQLVVTKEGAWGAVEVLQWLERNTQMFAAFGGKDYVLPKTSERESKKRINELLGMKEVLR